MFGLLRCCVPNTQKQNRQLAPDSDGSIDAPGLRLTFFIAETGAHSTFLTASFFCIS
jgi:hypothetical protein